MVDLANWKLETFTKLFSKLGINLYSPFSSYVGLNLTFSLHFKHSLKLPCNPAWITPWSCHRGVENRFFLGNWPLYRSKNVARSLEQVLFLSYNLWFKSYNLPLQAPSMAASTITCNVLAKIIIKKEVLMCTLCLCHTYFIIFFCLWWDVKRYI